LDFISSMHRFAHLRCVQISFPGLDSCNS